MSFKLGIYRHYKGGLYLAVVVASMHDSREKHVVYYSFEHETWNVRPLQKEGEDSWEDRVEIAPGVYQPRFEYLGGRG